jgi:hypothetical protein
MFFSHPNPVKLAANNDLHGLFDCVVGKDQNAAKQAATLLAGLVDDFDDAPGTHEVLRDLEGDASPMAVYALACVVRHGFERSSHVKSVAALALYRLHKVDELEKIVAELRSGEHAGGTLHAALSHDLLGAAVRSHDVATAQLILKNGQFASPGEIAAGLDLLRSSGGDAAVASVSNDPAVFSSAVRGIVQSAGGAAPVPLPEISA